MGEIRISTPSENIGFPYLICKKRISIQSGNLGYPSRKPTQPRIRFDLEKLNDPTVMSAFQETIGGRFSPLATLVDEDADLNSIVTNFNKAVTDTAAEFLGKQRRKRKPLVTPEILDLCDQRRDLKKKMQKTIERLKESSGLR